MARRRRRNPAGGMGDTWIWWVLGLGAVGGIAYLAMNQNQAAALPAATPGSTPAQPGVAPPVAPYTQTGTSTPIPDGQ